MSKLHRHVQDLIDDLYVATFHGLAWSEVLAALARALGCVSLYVAAVQRHDMGIRLADGGGIDASVGIDYTRHYYPADVRIPRLQALPGAFHYDVELMSDGERATSPIYCHFLRRLGIKRSLFVKFDLDDGHWGFAVFCRDSSADRYDDASTAAIAMLVTHLVTALRLRLRMPALEHAPAPAQPPPGGATEVAPGNPLPMLPDAAWAAIFVLDQRRQVVRLNHAATKLLAQPGIPLRIGNGRLCSHDGEADGWLQRVIADSTSHGINGSRIRMLGGAPDRQWTALAFPAVAFGAAASAAGHVALCVLERGAHFEWYRAILRKAYGMSPMQAGIAAHIVLGRGLGEAADLLQISRNTAKTHLRGAFARTLTSSQGELVAEINRDLFLIAPFALAERVAAAALFAPPTHTDDATTAFEAGTGLHD
ncbi:MAG: helix-turn-helix transcriptional regulator [Gammaproteobacteria bacterium]|nr:helix-turn-helix transcriptional regulator [Gammaproteobacteria bacterium]MCP5199952.1 helix-turn-helix transcriptional regulator [Gammaproteobacteria bacterium]